MSAFPNEKLNEVIDDHLSRLSQALRKKAIGQNEVVDIVAKTIQKNRVDDLRRYKPIGSFLFFGTLTNLHFSTSHFISFDRSISHVKPYGA